MKILISADMEGATGVTWPADVLPGTPQWERCRRHVHLRRQRRRRSASSTAAPTRSLVNEAHWTMRNLLLERLDDRAEMLTGRHKTLSMVEGVQHGDVDGIAFVGYHTGAGTEGVLAHTYLANSITGVWVNGVRASEGLLNAHVVAEYGVPVVLVTGDDLTCERRRRLRARTRVTVAVKDHVSRYAAVCRTPARTAADIRAAAKEATALAVRHEPVARRPLHRGAGVRRRAPGHGRDRGPGRGAVRGAAGRVHQRDDVRGDPGLQGGHDGRLGGRGGAVWLTCAQSTPRPRRRRGRGGARRGGDVHLRA